jgi:hypothetical protein
MTIECRISCAGAELRCEEERKHTSDTSAGCPATDFGKQKPKRKWGLLVGGGRAKPSSNTKGSKSSTLSKDMMADDVAMNRWSTGVPRLPLPATISKETMVCSTRVLLIL